MEISETHSLDLGTAQEILRLAGEAKLRMDFFTREDLARAAAELEIPEHLVEEAERLVLDKQSEADDYAEYRRKELWRTLQGLGVIVVILFFVFASGMSGIFGHAASGFKMFLKGGTALLFGRATQHEMDFRTWRAERFYKAEYGSALSSHIIEAFIRRNRYSNAEALEDWMVEVNGFSREAAVQAYRDYLQGDRLKFRPLSLAPEPRLTPAPKPAPCRSHSL